MSSKNPLVATTEKIVKEGINDMKKEPNVVDEAITHPITKYEIDTVNKTDKPQESKSKKDKYISNESNKAISFDK